MLKISQLEATEGVALLRLEGRVVGPWVDELRKSCEQARAAGHIVKLHLADVEFLDARGVALLSGLRAQGVLFLECPPFASEQLKRACPS